MANITIKDPKFEEPIKYYMDDRVKSELDNSVINSLEKKDKDFLMVFDGAEGSGKSTLAFQVGKYVDPTLNLNRVVFDADSFRKAIYKAKKGQVVIFDEAFTGLSSRASLSGINKALVSLMMQMRQKNLCIILVLPTFFLLDKYAALFRSKVLFHVYENKGIRGYFRVYAKHLKAQLYFKGKKDYAYRIRTRFKGRFYGVFALGDAKLEEKYRKIKEKALEDTQKNPMTATQVKYREQRDLLMYLYKKDTKISARKLSNYLEDYDFSISHQQISKILGKYGDLVKEEEEKEDLIAESEEKEEETTKNQEKTDKID